ncbi:MAG TPA: pyrroline-5-carboxylate reductase [Xanthobacteraceae bacterium]|nr:pyrroline-5-carboxylate reductase [Xanthobacteraceae bacterium]
MSPSTGSQTAARSLATFSGTILLAGAGKMGSAMLEGWLALGLGPEKIAAIEPQPANEITAWARHGLRLNPTPGAVGEAAAVVIAVKPQSAPEVMPVLTPFFGPTTVVVSIMAGRTLRFLDAALPGAALVRAMPNTPAAIGRGITVAVANARVSAKQRELVHALLSAVGAVEWVSDEALMDAVTALSGSGPAYVFLLAEAMAKAGVAAGLPAALASTLARATVAGAGELLHRSPLDAATLRQNVTSPGGTTAAALDVLMANDGLEPLMTKAIAAATRRSRELAG